MRNGERNAAGDDPVRRKAEERQAERRARKPGDSERSEADLQSLVHELEVHQIELEMQNEELRRAEAEAEDSRARHGELFDFAPLGYVTLDEGGLIVDVNLAGAELLKLPKSSLVGKPLVTYVGPDSRAAFERFLSEVLRTPEKRSCELHLVTGSPTPIEVAADAVLLPRHAGSDGSIQMALVDVTERRRAEAEKSRLVGELEASLARIKRLSGLLPICASCKRIRDDSGYWQQVEAYITDHSEAEFSHGLCPECIGKLYPRQRK